MEILRGRLEGLGPATAGALAAPLGLEPDDIDAALVALEAEGFVMRGRFTPGAPTRTGASGASAGCSRASIATRSSGCAPRSSRSRRATSCASCSTGSVSTDETRMEGPDALPLPLASSRASRPRRRLGDRDPAGAHRRLRAGLAGRPVPGRPHRLGAAGARRRQRLRPRRSAGAHHADHAAGAPHTRALGFAGRHRPMASQPSARAQAVLDCLRAHGASFFDEMAAGSGLLRPQVEEALAELVALGLVTSDSFGGLRALLVPSDRRKPFAGAHAPAARRASFGMEDAGRWALDAPVRTSQPDTAGQTQAVEHVARDTAAPLRRGVLAPAGARGRLAAAVARPAARLSPAGGARRDPRRPLRRRLLRRAVRVARRGRHCCARSGAGALPASVVSLSGADPLNLAGILTPGAKLAALTGNRLLYRDGVPVASLTGGEVQFLDDLDAPTQWQARKTLLRSATPALLADLG